MNHLTSDEIIRFISSEEEDVELIVSVNKHIRTCGKCLELVQAFQLVNDELEEIGCKADLDLYLKKGFKCCDDSSDNGLDK